MASYVCDLCGWQSDDRAATLSHMRAAHQVEDAGPVGSLEQDVGLLILRSGDQVTALDLDAWLGLCLCGHAEEDHGPSLACQVDGCLCACFETYGNE